MKVSPIQKNLQKKVIQKLEHHLNQKQANREWILRWDLNPNLENKFSLEEKLASFPYQIAEDGKACINDFYNPSFKDSDWTTRIPEGTNQYKKPKNYPSYLLNIPMKQSIGDTNCLEKITQILKSLEEDSFHKDATRSKTATKKRLAVVIGVNQIHSIDPSKNHDFAYLSSIEGINHISFRVFGFYLKLKWKKTNKNKDIYNKETSFLMVKALCDKPKTPEILRAHLEDPKNFKHQISIQEIRETVKNSRYTKKFVSNFLQNAKNSPLYFGTFDADVSNLRLKKGILSYADEKIRKNKNVVALTFGYRAPNDELPLLKYAVELDMRVREAICKHIPFGAYFPEPFSLFKIKSSSDKSSILHRISFKDGQNNSLEGRRLIQNAKKSGFFKDGKVIFDPKVAPVTDVSRMRTKKIKEKTSLQPKDFKRKYVLQTLNGGISQSHVKSRSWGENIYAALDHFTYEKPLSASTEIGRIFSIYNPISRMFSSGRYSSKVFDQVINNYPNHELTQIEEEILNDSIQKLKKFGMKAEDINMIEKAAQTSGYAIYQFLLDMTS